MTLCLGIDPDLHDLAIAAWDDNGPVAGHIVHVPRKKGVVENEAVLAMMVELTRVWPTWQSALLNSCAVEAQELRRGPGRQHARPQDIVTLGQVAGMAVMRVAAAYPFCSIYFPKPSQWKGAVAKSAMQARLYQELGWEYEIHGTGSNAYAVAVGVPERFEGFTDTQWKHLGDALLLARWCWQQAKAVAR